VSDARDYVPAGAPSLDALSAAAQGCRGCHLYEPAEQAVFGEGRPGARLVLVGEQPGDREDRDGRPFVGPAGRELDRGLEVAGIDRGEVYVTNAVKHFKFTERGGRRIHPSPNQMEIKACRPWLDEELRVVEPEAVVALGAVAAKALLGSKSGSPVSAAGCFDPTSHRWSPQPSIPRRSCASATKRSGKPSARRSRRTWPWWPGRWPVDCRPNGKLRLRISLQGVQQEHEHLAPLPERRQRELRQDLPVDGRGSP